ncbi:unnamed protein product, partial [Amoebophrya sp. A25]|eukprot:GSA25T00022390001.1
MDEGLTDEEEVVEGTGDGHRHVGATADKRKGNFLPDAEDEDCTEMFIIVEGALRFNSTTFKMEEAQMNGSPSSSSTTRLTWDEVTKMCGMTPEFLQKQHDAFDQNTSRTSSTQGEGADVKRTVVPRGLKIDVSFSCAIRVV